MMKACMGPIKFYLAVKAADDSVQVLAECEGEVEDVIHDIFGYFSDTYSEQDLITRACMSDWSELDDLLYTDDIIPFECGKVYTINKMLFLFPSPDNTIATFQDNVTFEEKPVLVISQEAKERIFAHEQTIVITKNSEA